MKETMKKMWIEFGVKLLKTVVPMFATFIGALLGGTVADSSGAMIGAVLGSTLSVSLS